MRVLLSTFGSRGDVEPLVGFAVALRERGAQVRVVAPPDQEFARRLASVDVPLEPVEIGVRKLVTARQAPPPETLPQRALMVRDAQWTALTSAVNHGVDVVVGTGLYPAVGAAHVLADRYDLDYRYVTFIPKALPSPHHPPFAFPGRPLPVGETDNRKLWDLDVENVDALFGPSINGLREDLGLRPVEHIGAYVHTERPWLAADPVLGPYDGWLDAIQTGSWFRPDDRPLPEDLEAFLDAGDPPVYVGFGSMPMTAAPNAAQDAVEAARAHGRRVVLSRGWAELAHPDDDVLPVGEANHQALFRRVAAVVHHGGAGTTTTAARAGAPQVVVPQIADQPYWAGRVAALGIGAAHDGPVPTRESLTDTLAVALAPATRLRADDVAARITNDGAARAADLLLTPSVIMESERVTTKGEA